jgi:hypothetical protein
MDVYARRRLVAGVAVVGVLVVIIVAIASAGGDDDDEITPVEGVGGGSAGSASKSEFIDEADSICAEANAAVANLAASPAANVPELLAEQQYEYARGELEQLQTLTPPEDDRSALDRFYTALRDQIDVLRKQQLAIQRGDDDALAEVSEELPAADAEVRAAAADYGFDECGTEGAPPTDADSGAAIAPTDVTGAPTDVTEAPAVAPEAPVETTPAAPVETPPAEAPGATTPPTDTGTTSPPETGGGVTEPPATEPPSGGTAPGDSGGVSP